MSCKLLKMLCTQKFSFIILLNLIFLSGCSINPKVSNSTVKINISDGKAYAYAYINKNGDVLKVLKNVENNDYEYIKITKNGFYPMYGTRERGCSNYKKSKYYGGNSWFCNSFFIETDVYKTSTIGVFMNLINTVTNLGLNFVVGDVLVFYSFDKEKFKQIVYRNNLVKTRKLVLYASENKVHFTDAKTLTKSYIEEQIKLNKIKLAKAKLIAEKAKKEAAKEAAKRAMELDKIKKEQEKKEMEREEEQIEQERIDKENFRLMMRTSEAEGFCEEEWMISFWQKNKTGVKLRKIGKKRYMTKCISIRVNREAETSEEIARKVIKYYGQ